MGFVAKREQQGHKDDEPQFYVIAPDGGEARRVGTVATGVEGFRWFPDGKRIAFVSWVWPELKGDALISSHDSSSNGLINAFKAWRQA